MTVQIGYVGLDHHHRSPYLDSIEQLPVEIVAVADSDTSPAAVGEARLERIPYYEEPEQMLDEADVDLVWITLSNAATPGLIAAAVERGIDVFTEKPVARTAAELEPVVEAAKEGESTVGVSYIWRGHPLSGRLRELQRAGFFGKVHSFDLRFVASQLATRDTDHYLFDRTESRGGIVQWLGVHWLDLLPWILDDEITRVNARVLSTNSKVDVEYGATIQLETASGAIGTHTCGYYLRDGRYDTEINIYGEQGQSTWDPMGPTFGFDGQTTFELDSSAEDWSSTPHRRVTHDYAPAPGYGGHWGLRYFEQFLDACNGTSDPIAGLDDALTVLRVLDAVYESAAEERWITVPNTR